MVWPRTSAKTARANQQLPAMHWWFAAAPPWWGRWNCGEIERKSSDVADVASNGRRKHPKCWLNGIYWGYTEYIMTGWYLGNGIYWDQLRCGATPKMASKPFWLLVVTIRPETYDFCWRSRLAEWGCLDFHEPELMAIMVAEVFIWFHCRNKVMVLSNENDERSIRTLDVRNSNDPVPKSHFLDMCNTFHTLSWFPRAKDNFNEAEWTDDAGGMGLDWGIYNEIFHLATWSAMSRLRLGLNPFLLILNVPLILKTGIHLQFPKISVWPIWLLIDPL